MGKCWRPVVQVGRCGFWDTDTGKEIRSLPIDKGYRVLAMAFTPDSKHLAFNNRSEDGIQLVDVAEGKLVLTFKGHKDNVYQLTFSADGKTLISSAADNDDSGLGRGQRQGTPPLRR